MAPVSSGRQRVRVRNRGRGRVLEVDGALASCWKPDRPATGSVWDALAAPLLALPHTRRRSVLILGLGGGSVARLVRSLAPGSRLVGVEVDPEVVRAAHRWFRLDALDIEVARADAHAWLRAERRRFDLVLEDVFVGPGRAVAKPPWLPEPGLRIAARRLARGGLLATNALDEAPRAARALARLFPSVVEIRVAGYDNRILVGAPDLDARRLRGAVAGEPSLRATLPRLSFRTVVRGS